MSARYQAPKRKRAAESGGGGDGEGPSKRVAFGKFQISLATRIAHATEHNRRQSASTLETAPPRVRKAGGVEIAAELGAALKPHQAAGVQFMHDCVVDNCGCVLAHAPGLGKTLQIVTLVHSLMHSARISHVLVVAPAAGLYAWRTEFDAWLAPANRLAIRDIGGESPAASKHLAVLAEWQAAGGVLLLASELVAPILTAADTATDDRTHSSIAKVADLLMDGDDDGLLQFFEAEMEAVDGEGQGHAASAAAAGATADDSQFSAGRVKLAAILRTTPDLVVFDDAVALTSSKKNALLSLLKTVTTPRRIVLAGYPVHTHLAEYYGMVDFVRPDYLGTAAQFLNNFERPITAGRASDSHPSAVRHMQHRLCVLERLLSGIVHRLERAVLLSELPPLHDHAVHIRLSAMQERLYSTMLQRWPQTGSAALRSLFKIFTLGAKIWDHPDIFHKATLPKPKRKGRAPRDKTADQETTTSSGGAGAGGPLAPLLHASGSLTWAAEALSSYDAGVVEHSNKLAIFLDLLQQTVLAGERMALFAQNVDVLDILEDVLQRTPIPQAESSGAESSAAESSAAAHAAEPRAPCWTRNASYVRLEGNLSARHALVERFNSPANVDTKLFLAVTRAAGTGLNLIGASRVVIFDVSWPTGLDTQVALSVHRFRQQRPCHIYRFVAAGTAESVVHVQHHSHAGHQDTDCRDESLILTYEAPAVRPDHAPLHFDSEDPLLQRTVARHAAIMTQAPTHVSSSQPDGLNESLLLSEAEQAQVMTDFAQELAAAHLALDQSLSQAQAQSSAMLAGGVSGPPPAGLPPGFERIALPCAHLQIPYVMEVTTARDLARVPPFTPAVRAPVVGAAPPLALPQLFGCRGIALAVPANFNSTPPMS